MAFGSEAPERGGELKGLKENQEGVVGVCCLC